MRTRTQPQSQHAHASYPENDPGPDSEGKQGGEEVGKVASGRVAGLFH